MNLSHETWTEYDFVLCIFFCGGQHHYIAYQHGYDFVFCTLFVFLFGV